MLSAAHFKWLPNALTLSRAILGGVVFVCALNDAWVWAFWLYAFALLTDFLDGLAAKKLNAYSPYGMKFDSFADGILAAGGGLGLAAAGHLPWWVVTLMLLSGFIMGSRHYLPFIKSTMVVDLTAKASLFSAWVIISWLFLSLAYGWSWWYVPLTLLALVLSARLKKHRLRAWLRIPEARGVRPSKRPGRRA